MIKKRILLAGIIALMMCGITSMNAQVTIGADKTPEPFSVLELISNQKHGLRLPQIRFGNPVDSATFVQSLKDAGELAQGLQIFNLNTKCVETWNGAQWITLCVGTPYTSNYTATLNANGGTLNGPSTLTAGADGKLIPPADPTPPPGDIFLYWEDLNKPGVPFDFSTSLTGDITLRAHYCTPVTPTFGFGSALTYCIGATPATLPTTSTNGITGTWSPATISTAAIGGPTRYTFTPTAGQCVIGTGVVTLDVTVVTSPITPTFDFGSALTYCVGATPATLPTASSNGVSGTWSPATISTATADGPTPYTFTPTAGQCVIGTGVVTLDVTVVTALTQDDPEYSSICSNVDNTITLAEATGGTGTITYEWEQSSDGTDWTTAEGISDGANYTIPANTLSTDMYYRRQAIANCGTVTSEAALITLAVPVCRTDVPESATLNGLTWATKNVGASSGSFSANVCDPGNFYTFGTNVCPSGYHVPSVNELISLYNSGSVWIESTTAINLGLGCLPGMIFGTATAPNNYEDFNPNTMLFLPAAGLNPGGYAAGVGSAGYYWSNTNSDNTVLSYYMSFNNSSKTTTIISGGNNGIPNTFGLSMRCVSDVTCTPLTQDAPEDMTTCANVDYTITLAAATGGSGTITYNWQQSSDGTNWTDATGTRDAANYTIPANTISTDMYYRRQATSSPCGTITSAAAMISLVTAVCRTDVPESINLNGYTWATKNVGASGSFTANVCDPGNLYTFGSNVCPSGYHVPNDNELQTLVNAGSVWINSTTAIDLGLGCLGGFIFGTTIAPNSYAAFDPNTMLFLPATGLIPGSGSIAGVGNNFLYWSSNEASNPPNSFLGSLLRSFYGDAPVVQNSGVPKIYSLPVRCVSNTTCAAIPLTQGNLKSMSVCDNIDNTITLAEATGGDGTITYNWQQSSDGTNWTDATGTRDGANYTIPAGTLSTGMYYRRQATSSPCGTINSTAALISPTTSVCRTDVPESATINGYTWATKNVGASGSFSANVCDPGNLYKHGQNVCPSGYHVPNNNELQLLVNAGSVRINSTTAINLGLGCLGGYIFGTTTAPNSYAAFNPNTMLFLPAAGFDNVGGAGLIGFGNYAFYWSSDNATNPPNSFIGSSLQGSGTGVGVSTSGFDKNYGLSVRCAANPVCINASVTPAASAANQLVALIPGNTLTFKVTGGGSPTLSYQWYKAGVAVSGQTSATFTKANAVAGDAGNYYCVVTSSCNNTAANSAIFVVSTTCTNASVTPATSAGNQPVAVTTGTTLTLTVTGAGSPTLSYQWYKGSSSSPVGINSATYTKANAVAGDAGNYYCVVTSSCNNSTATSATFVVTVAADPSTMTLGAGSLTGRTCFDIAEINNGPDCGDLTSRAANKANFAALTTADKTYTFTATTAGVSKVRFVVVDNEGCVTSTSSLTPNGNGGLANGSSVSLTVNYKTTLNLSTSTPKIQGRTRNQAAVVMIYVVYYNGTQDVSVPLKVTIQDCACCGALVAPNTWKVFMCHNLGADYSADPFTPTYATNGAYYQWGRKDPAGSAPLPDGTDATVIPWTWNSPPGGWFGSNTPNANDVTKSAYDPCPPGYRIPSYDEWNYLWQNNTQTNIGLWTSNLASWVGIKYGSALMLPEAGSRGIMFNDIGNRGRIGYYWSTYNYDQINQAAYILHITFNTSSKTGMVGLNYRHALSIRCIAQ